MTSHLRRTLEAMQARQDGFRGGRGTQPGPGAEAEEAGAAVLAPGKGCWGPECWGWGGGAFAAAAGAGGGGTMARGADGGGAPPRNGGGCGGPSICARVLYYALVTFSCSRESPAAGSRESPAAGKQPPWGAALVVGLCAGLPLKPNCPTCLRPQPSPASMLEKERLKTPSCPDRR